MTTTKLVNENSLSITLANLNEALLGNETLSQSQRDEVADWIASRVDVPGSYRGMPAPTGRDFQAPLRLFTGETVNSRAGRMCKLGFEATWALMVLRPKRAAAVAAASLCRQRALSLFAYEKARRKGMYCCYSCSNAGWRVLGAATVSEGGQSLDAALALLRANRDGKGRWHKFPFWYTLFALSDMDQPRALEELRYAAPALEGVMGRKPKTYLYGRRRRLIAERILGRV